VLGIFAAKDARVNSGRDRAEAALTAAGLTHELYTAPGVDHAFFTTPARGSNAPRQQTCTAAPSPGSDAPPLSPAIRLGRPAGRQII
jgi:dienelactone hydrolase